MEPILSVFWVFYLRTQITPNLPYPQGFPLQKMKTQGQHQIQPNTKRKQAFEASTGRSYNNTHNIDLFTINTLQSLSLRPHHIEKPSV